MYEMFLNKDNKYDICYVKPKLQLLIDNINMN